MIKIKRGDFEILQDCMVALDSAILSRKVSNKITDFTVKIFDDEFKIFNKMRIKICETYAEKDENGGFVLQRVMNQLTGKIGQEYVFSDENKVKFNEEINQFYNEEIELDFEPILSADLNDAKGLSVFVEKNLKRLGLIK